ncbi:MAG: protein kinase [Pyrinomonadaceae bacterium]|nr:protein kinase [Pyrinomonadaceae bacterium]
MNTAEWLQIKDLVSQAIDLPDDQRVRFLASISDSTIRTEVKDLLASMSDSADFIETPLMVELGAVENEIVDRLIGTTIGNYSLLKRLGSGGMGAVYLAKRENADFTQFAALKIIKRGMDSEAIVQRFSNERRILSSLKHPNIAQLIDGGISADGLPFFVMEYVEGEPLNEFCRIHDLGLEERLDIFRKICSAVEHAHKNLVVHRDLKPSNIIVTEDSVPKLLDFGIAKVLANQETLATETGAFGKMLTPEYASPEQIAGKPVTTTSDVYSLGVILYELLTNQRPFDFRGRSYEDLIDTAKRTEPPRPSQTASRSGLTSEEGSRAFSVPKRLLQGDLDNIILKALRTDPSERYDSVRQFSEDISRYLTGKPVHARPQTARYRFEKYYMRHKIAVLSAAMVLISLITGISIATWQAIAASRERSIAERRFREVREMANSLMFDIHDSIKDLPGTTPARKLLVEKALAYLDQLSAESTDDDTLKIELANGYEKIADVQGGAMGSNLGDSSGALASYAKALAIREELAEKSGSGEQQYAAAILHSKSFQVLMLLNDFEKAEIHSSLSIEILAKLTAAQPGNSVYRITAARFYLERGDLLASLATGDANLALENYRQSIIAAESVPENGELDQKAADGLTLREKILSVEQMAYRRIGQNAIVRKQPEEAFANYEKALEKSRQLAAQNDPPKPQHQIVLAISLGNLARAQADDGDLEKAIANAANMLEICEKVANDDPKNYLAVSQLSLAHESLGSVYFKLRNFPRALENLGEARRIQEAIKQDHPEDIYNIGNLGETYAFIGVIHEELAKSRTRRTENLATAAGWHRQSLDIWLELERNGTLPAYYGGKIEEQRKALARCRI